MPTLIPVPYAELATYPKAGQTVTLPAGLKYFNEFYASNHVMRTERSVKIVEVCRDEIYWRLPNGESCYARWRRRAALSAHEALKQSSQDRPVAGGDPPARVVEQRRASPAYMDA